MTARVMSCVTLMRNHAHADACMLWVLRMPVQASVFDEHDQREVSFHTLRASGCGNKQKDEGGNGTRPAPV